MPAMLSMGMGNRAPKADLWAADSGRYNNPKAYSDEKYLAFLTRHAWALERCIFATAPDVVGDAAQTLELSAPMFGRIAAAGYPVALVAQDGLENFAIPWRAFDALFIGGTTAYKVSEQVRELCLEARRRGKWVHMGRVNSHRRMRTAQAFGCDSVDGTRIAFSPDEGEPLVRSWLRSLHERPSLWHTEEVANG